MSMLTEIKSNILIEATPSLLKITYNMNWFGFYSEGKIALLARVIVS